MHATSLWENDTLIFSKVFVYHHRTIGLFFYQLAACEVRGRLVLRLLCVFCVCWHIYLCVRTYHVRNNYVTYIVAMRPYFILVDFGNLDGCFE